MKYGKTHNCKDCYPLIQLLTEDCIDELNRVFGTHHSRQEVKEKIRVIRKEESQGFYKRLMEEKPGFGKGDNV